MGTKQHPGRFDCHARALDDEPTFTLLARDPSFGEMVRAWADRREAAVRCGDRPESDMELVWEARVAAQHGETWRRENMGKWRGPPPAASAEPVSPREELRRRLLAAPRFADPPPPPPEDPLPASGRESS